MRTLTAGWIASLALLAASCGGAADPPPTPPAETAGTGPTATPTAIATTPADGNGENAGTETPGAGCGVTADWTLLPDVAEGGGSRDPIEDVRAGRHECFDRVVFDLGGASPAGFDAEYVPEVTTQGKGDPVPLAGAAAMRVIVRSPARGSLGGGVDREPLAPESGRFVPESALADWDALRSLRYAGSFEGQTSFALGVRERLPFRVFARLDSGSGMRQVVVDIAHSTE